MKKLLSIVLVCAATVSISGCNDFLTQEPKNQLSSLGYWSTTKDCEYWMNGIYNSLVNLSGQLRSYGEGRSDAVFPTTYGQGSQYQLNSLTSGSTDVDWTPFYTVIARCNIALANIPGMSAVPEVDKQQFMAECLGIRGLMYFYMVRLWGACPLMLEPWDFAYETRYNERTSVADVTAAIESDLKNSILYFEGAGSRKNTAAYFNLSGAYAFQMDFLTWQRKWAEVIGVYNKFTTAYPNKGLVAGVPGEGNFMTNVALWKQNFLPETAGTDARETIFSLVYNPANYGTSVRSPWASDVGYSGSNSSFALSRNTYLMMVQDIGDVRLGGSIRYPQTNAINLVPANAPVYEGPNNNVQAVDKYHPNSAFMTFTAGATWYFPCPIYRYADVILLYAEALNRVDEANGQAVIDVINRIRASRGSSIVFDLANYPLQLGGSSASRERLVMDERLLEFYGEPKRWFDLIRLDWGYDVIDQHVAYLQGQLGEAIVGFGDKNRLLFPISQGNLTRNPKLKQNPGY